MARACRLGSACREKMRSKCKRCLSVCGQKHFMRTGSVSGSSYYGNKEQGYVSEHLPDEQVEIPPATPAQQFQK